MKNNTSFSSGTEILSGYRPGLIGEITRLHAVYYYENWGFHINFETQVATELSQFCLRLNPETDGLWSSTVDGEFTGSVAIDGSLRETQGARLRWFIVAPAFQGTGIGRVLLKQAIDFCGQKSLNKIFLWTFKGLEAARTLYERAGFLLVEEHVFSGWGSEITEQKFELNLGL